MLNRSSAFFSVRPLVIAAGIFWGLRWMMLQNYLLFHTLAELFSVIIAAAIFTIAWTGRRFQSDAYLTFLGSACLCVAGLDLVHAIAYKGVGVFPGSNTDLATQIWIAARYVQSLSLLAAPLFIRRNPRPLFFLAGFGLTYILVLLTIFKWGVFPHCFVEGSGLTVFKRLSEYIICLITVVAMAALYARRASLDRGVVDLLLLAMGVSVVQELAFTLYLDPYGIWNFSGHCLKILAFFLIYKAIVETGLTKPYSLLFFDMKRTEESLRSSEKRFRTLADASFEGICLSENGIIVDCNDRLAAQLGYARAELLGKAVRDLIPGSSRDAVLDNILAEREAVTEHELFRKDGTVIAVEAHGKTVTDQDRAVRITAVRNVTAQREAAREKQLLLEAERAARGELEKANRLKDEFLATLSHELRSPLSTVLGWVRLLKRNKGTDVDEALAVIERNAEALGRLIGEMLDTARIMSGKVRLEVEEVEANAFISELIESFRPAAEAKGICLRGVYSTQTVPLSCDPSRLGQVVSNLINNALKFTPHDGTIWVRVRNRPSGCLISVRDTGQGIPVEFLGQIFDKFLQVDASTTRRHGGLGLGLAIAKQIVEMHGGEIRARSGGPGKGARFVVILPRAEAVPGGSSLQSGAAGADGPLELPAGLTILLVDDDPDSLGVVNRILTESKAAVVVAHSASEGLEKFAQHRPSFVISDLSMPNEDGFSLIKKIRALENGQKRAVCVALSALTRPEDREQALKAGFDEHLSKLEEPSAIIRAVRELVANSIRLGQERSIRADGVRCV